MWELYSGTGCCFPQRDSFGGLLFPDESSFQGDDRAELTFHISMFVQRTLKIRASIWAFTTAMLGFDRLFPFYLKVAGQTASFTSFYEQGMRDQDRQGLSLAGSRELGLHKSHCSIFKNASTSSPRPPTLSLRLQGDLFPIWLRRNVPTAVLAASPSHVFDSSSQQLEIKADK